MTDICGEVSKHMITVLSVEGTENLLGFVLYSTLQ